MAICEDCATDDDREGSYSIGVSEGRTCDRCGQANTVGSNPDHVCGKGTQGMIVQLDGETVRQLYWGRDEKARGKAKMWSYLGPIHVYGDFPAGTLEIRENTRIRHQELEKDLVAKQVGVDEDTGMTYVQFLVDDCMPIQKHLTYSYDKILEELEDGHLITKETLNKRAEQALQKIRERKEA